MNWRRYLKIAAEVLFCSVIIFTVVVGLWELLSLIFP